MAHPCWSCGSECYCHGDIDDIIVSKTPKGCEGCGCDEFFDPHFDEDEDDEDWDDMDDDTENFNDEEEVHDRGDDELSFQKRNFNNN